MTFQKISKKALIDICCINCINKTKIDELFPNSQSRWMGTSFPQFNVIEIIEVAENIFCYFFTYRPPNSKNRDSFEEISDSWNKAMNGYEMAIGWWIKHKHVLPRKGHLKSFEKFHWSFFFMKYDEHCNVHKRPSGTVLDEF